MAQRMVLEKDILELVVDQFCWRIVITLDFIADNLYFLVNLMLGILAVEDDISQYIDGLGEVLLRNGSIEDRILFIGKGIQVSTHPLKGIDNLQRVATGCSLEGHVFAEVGYSFLTRHLVTGACCNIIAAEDHLRG